MTDPEELRARASSIFQQLRGRDGTPTDKPDGDDATEDGALPDPYGHVGSAASPDTGTGARPAPGARTPPRASDGQHRAAAGVSRRTVAVPRPGRPHPDGDRGSPAGSDATDPPILDPEGAAALDAWIRAAERSVAEDATGDDGGDAPPDAWVAWAATGQTDADANAAGHPESVPGATAQDAGPSGDDGQDSAATPDDVTVPLSFDHHDVPPATRGAAQPASPPASHADHPPSGRASTGPAPEPEPGAPSPPNPGAETTTSSLSPPSTATGSAPDPGGWGAPATDTGPGNPTPDRPVLPPSTTATGHPGARRPLPRILAIANQKGGVGKTTTAVNLGASLAELRHRVLVVDLDPQGNATTGLGINARSLESSVYDVILHDVPAEDVIEPTALRNLFVLPATIDLAGAEIELVPVFSRELRLRRALESVHGDYDYVLIDCPPSLGLLTINGLAAANEVAVPIQCEYYALEGLGQLLRNVTMVQANLNAGLELTTIILTMYDARTRLAEQVVSEVRDHFGDRVCRNVVPRTVRLSEAPSFGQPIIVFDSSSRGSIAYRELAKEVSGGTSQRVG